MGGQIDVGSGDLVFDGGANDYDFTVQDMASTSIEGNNASFTGLTTLSLDGQRTLELFARTNFYLWTPQVWAQTATNGHVLRLIDLTTGETEFDDVGNAVLHAGNTLLKSLLIGWAAGESYTLTSATRDTDDVITTATVVWPDGSGGTFTTTTKNTEFTAIDAYTVTHTSSGKTVTQTAVTRNSNGAVTAQPALTVTP
jgi:hypothetical protein